MRDFSWNVFANSGDVDAYMLYKEVSDPSEKEPLAQNEMILEEEAII
ncbi:hypothetical protein J2Z69_000192 [Paenibacillus shirakamiensis]|uniref:YqzL family protein n=1 Tax=Paenibacillus shirakamiensis TaxID=1265935 RepID=A0ABS4JBS2_9BACL|nr:YqzL family protein [Paenibacillus shirakamiensis]MBP1999173.1 hypothetical protein [Paenibacillus shirakamiensis]